MEFGANRASRTVYVTTAGPDGAAVREMVTAWAAAGIVKGSLWVTPDDLVAQRTGPPVVEAVEIRRDEQRKVDLFTALGTHTLDSVRLIVVHLITASGEHDPGVSETGRTLEKAIRSALPRRQADDVGTGSTRLRLLNVLVPVSGASQATEALLMPGWDVNIVVSPEDRPDLDRSTIFVRHPGNYIGHAASALCGLGGLLEGMEEGALDHLELDSTNHEDDVVLARFTVRSIVGEDIVETLAEQTFDIAAFGPDGPANLLQGVRTAVNPVEIGQRAAEHVLATDLWRVEQPDLGRKPVAKSRGMWRALAVALSFIGRMFGVMFRWLLTGFRISIEQQATNIIVGEEAGISVRIGAAPADEIAEAAELELASIEAQVARTARAPDQQLLHLNPSAWTLVRKMATSLADGSELPEQFPEPRTSGQRELLPPAAIVPVLEDVWTGVDKRVIEPLDVKGAFDYADHVQEQLSKEQQNLEQLVASVEVLETQVEDLREKVAKLEEEAEDSEPTEDEDNARSEKSASAAKLAKSIRSTTAALARTEKQLEKAAAKRAESEALVSKLEEEDSDFDKWVRSKASYMRTLVTGLVERRAVLKQEEDDAKDAKPAAPPRERLVKRQKAVRVVWILTLLATLTFAAIELFGGPFALTQENLPSWMPPIAVEIAIGVAIAIAILALANHAFYRAVQEYEWSLAQLIASRRAASEKAIWRRAQMARLDAQAIAMADWGRILGTVLHQPWGGPRSQQHELADGVVDKLPAAMGVAGLSRTTEIPFHSMASAARAVYVPGWLSRAYGSIVQSFDNIDVANDTGFSSIDADMSDRPTGPRRRFLDYLNDPESRVEATEIALDRFRAGIESQEIKIPTRTVQRRGPFSNELEVDEPSYFTAAAGESITFASDVFSPTGMQRRVHYVARSAVWLPGSVDHFSADDQMRVMKANGANAVRVDLSKRLTAHDLVLFGTAPPTPVSATPEEASPQSPEPKNQSWL